MQRCKDIVPLNKLHFIANTCEIYKRKKLKFKMKFFFLIIEIVYVRDKHIHKQNSVIQTVRA